MASFIRKLAGKSDSELAWWTVALISSVKADSIKYRTFAGYEIGLIERNPEEQNATSYSLKKANILSPSDESLDFQGEVFDRPWFEAIEEKAVLRDDVEWLTEQIGKDAIEVAKDLTRRWQQSNPPKLKSLRMDIKDIARPNGRVVRVLRRRSHGLLLIYPLQQPGEILPDWRLNPAPPPEPTGLDPSGSPVIGLAVSFPTSDTVMGVEYRVNKVWDAEIQEDSAYED